MDTQAKCKSVAVHWPLKRGDGPHLTAEDLSEDGWEIKRRELEALGINPSRFLAKHIRGAIRDDPGLRQALQDLRAGHSEKQQMKDGFFRWGYRAALTGVVSLIVVGALRLSPAWNDARSLVYAVGAVACAAILVATAYSLSFAIRYFRTPSE